MESVFENAHLKFLPDEILIAILKLLPFEDLMHFCQAFNADYLLKMSLINKIDPKQYIDLDLKQLVAKINPLFVTNVNLNGYHWITTEQLRIFVAQLTNLDKLTLLGTKMRLSDEDLKAYSKTKLTKLAVTIENTSKLKGKSVVLPTLNTLCLNIEKTEGSQAEFTFETPDFIRVFPSLEKLWFEFPSSSIRLRRRGWPSGLKKLYLNGQQSIILPNTLSKFYYGQKRKQNYILCLEHFDKPLLPNLEIPSSVWSNCGEIPWGPKDGRRLYTGEKDLETINFEELNCNHNSDNCEEVRDSYKAILRLPNTHSVKKLSVTNCLITTPYYESKIDHLDRMYWTLAWTSHCQDTVKILNDFENAIVECEYGLSNFKEVTHLELFVCKNNWGICNCRVIAQFTNLTSLYIQIPMKNNGQFMIEVATNCKLLEKLWIVAKDAFNDETNGNIAKALPHCRNLKEFTFCTNDLNIDELLSALKTVKLRKLVLMCETPSLTETCLQNYFEENPQLLYCNFKLNCLVGRGSKKRFAVKTFQKYRKHDRNVFIVTGDYTTDCSEPESSPDEDDTDESSSSNIEKSLWGFPSSVCNLVLEDEFETF